MTAPVLQRFALNFWTLTVSKVLYRLVSIGVAMYLARALGAAVLGSYATVMNVLTLYLAFADLGVTNLVIRDVSQNRELAASYLDNFFVLQFLVGLLLIGLIMLTGWFSGYERILLIALAIGSIGPFFSGLSNAYQALMNAHELFYPFAVIEVACMLLFLAGNVLVVLLGEGLLALIAVTSVVSFAKYVLGAAWARRFAMRVRWRFRWDAVRRMLAAGLPFLLINGTHFAIQRMDILFLSWTLSGARVGVYAAASRLVFASLFVLASVGALLYPVFSRLLVENPARAASAYARGTLYVFLLSALMAQLLITLAPDIVGLLYGADFTEAVSVLQLLALFLPLFGIGLLASNVLMVSGAVWRAVWASIVALAVGVVAAPFAIAAWEIEGAAIAVLFAEGVAAVLYIVFAARSLSMSLPLLRILAGATAVSFPPLLLMLGGMPPGPLPAVAALCLSLLLLFLLRVLTVRDLREIHSLLLRRESAA
ncbi:MAG: oligosaccharide flippase family protein [Bacteroidota bacterium]|nr:oligosaccharide flippase family protein [Bacteroidota bacterium]